jgi:hypothetical protein
MYLSLDHGASTTVCAVSQVERRHHTVHAAP